MRDMTLANRPPGVRVLKRIQALDVEGDALVGFG